MKKNIFLTFILSCLITFAYFSEEVMKGEKKDLARMKSRLIESSFPITELKTKNYHFILKDKLWIEKSTNWRIDQEVLTEIINIFQDLGRYSSIEKKDNKEYFSETKIQFDVLVNGIWKKYILGNASKITGSFYIKDLDHEDLVNICLDESLLQVIHKSEVDLKLKKYLRLKNIINSKVANFFDHNLLSGLQIDLDEITTMTIDNKANRWFSLDFSEMKTSPLALDGIKYRNFFNRVMEGIEKVKITSIISHGQNILSNPRSRINFKGKEELNIKLYSSLNGKYGNYLKVDGRNDIIEVELKDSSLFFLNIQDFWIKKINYDIDFKKLNEVNFKISFDNRKFFDFIINDLESFKVIPLDKKVSFVSNTHMNFLFNLLFNLADFKQAHYIEKIQGDAVNLNKEKFDLYINLFGKFFTVKIEDDFILVGDYNDKVLFKFKYNQGQIEPGFFDKIFTVVKK
jgi:hypothetical protein